MWAALLQGIVEALGEAAAATGEAVGSVGGAIGDAAGAVTGAVGDAAGAVGSAASSAYQGASGLLSGIMGGGGGGKGGDGGISEQVKSLMPNVAESNGKVAPSPVARAAPPNTRVYSQAQPPMQDRLPMVTPSEGMSTWDKLMGGVQDAWHGYQNMEIGPDAASLTPDERSSAFWSSKFNQLRTGLSGRGDPVAAQRSTANAYVRNSMFNHYLDRADQSAQTPADRDRVAAMRATRQYTRPPTATKFSNPYQRPISDTQSQSFQIDPATGQEQPFGDPFDRYKPASGTAAQKTADRDSEIEGARIALSQLPYDKPEAFAPELFARATKKKSSESQGEYLSRLEELRHPKRAAAAPADSKPSALHSGLQGIAGAIFDDMGSLFGKSGQSVDPDEARRRGRGSLGLH